MLQDYYHRGSRLACDAPRIPDTDTIFGLTPAAVIRGDNLTLPGAAEAKQTIIIVSHKLSSVENADMIVVMENDRVAQKGTHDKLLNQEGYNSRIYHRQQLESEVKSTA